MVRAGREQRGAGPARAGSRQQQAAAGTGRAASRGGGGGGRSPPRRPRAQTHTHTQWLRALPLRTGGSLRRREAAGGRLGGGIPGGPEGILGLFLLFFVSFFIRFSVKLGWDPHGDRGCF